MNKSPAITPNAQQHLHGFRINFCDGFYTSACFFQDSFCARSIFMVCKKSIQKRFVLCFVTLRKRLICGTVVSQKTWYRWIHIQTHLSGEIWTYYQFSPSRHYPRLWSFVPLRYLNVQKPSRMGHKATYLNGKKCWTERWCMQSSIQCMQRDQNYFVSLLIQIWCEYMQIFNVGVIFWWFAQSKCILWCCFAKCRRLCKLTIVPQ